MVKEKKYPEALAYLEQALDRAQGYKVKVNRVCDMEGLCLAFRPLEAVYGNQDLAPLVQLNLSLVKAKLAERKSRGRPVSPPRRRTPRCAPTFTSFLFDYNLRPLRKSIAILPHQNVA